MVQLSKAFRVGRPLIYVGSLRFQRYQAYRKFTWIQVWLLRLIGKMCVCKCALCIYVNYVYSRLAAIH